MAKIPASTSREAVRQTVPKLIDLTEKVLFSAVWQRPRLSKRDRTPIPVGPPPASAPVAGRWDWWLGLGAAGVAALFGNLGYLVMVLDDLHRTDPQARPAQIDASASRSAAQQPPR